MYLKEEHFVLERTEIRGKREIKIGKFYFILTNKTYNTLGGIRNAIRPFGFTVKQYYDLYYKTEEEGKCIICGNECKFKNLVVGYGEYCSDVCFNKSPEKRKKISNRFVNNPEKFESYKKLRKSNWDARTEEEINKAKVNYRLGQLKIDPELKRNNCKKANERLQQLCKENPNKRVEIVNKTLATKIANNSFGNGISGKVKTLTYKELEFTCQGYEDILIKYLIDTNIKFFGRGNVPEVNIESNASKKYVADIFLPDYNLLIDVKSEYTMPITNESVAHYLERQNATQNQSMNFIIFAIHSYSLRKDRILSEYDRNLFDNYLTMLISSQALIEGRFNDYPVIRSTLQAIGSGSAGKPKRVCDIV
nr:MAG: hypothetical protein [Caudoviricetes sp.]